MPAAPVSHASLAGVRGLAFEGGGVLGLCYVSAIESLQRHGVDLGTVNRYAGASAGAITAALLACGATPEDMRRLWVATEFETVFGGKARWTALRKLGGLRPLTRPRAWIREAIASRGVDPDTPLSLLEAATGSSLWVTATNLEAGMTVTWGPESDLGIADAVLASMAIPAYYQPHEIGGNHFADGGVASNLPLLELGLAPAECIGFRLDGEGDASAYDPDSIPCGLRRIAGKLALVLWGNVAALRRAANERHVPADYWPRIVRIPTGRYGATDWHVAQHQPSREHLENTGRLAFERWAATATARGK